MNGSVIDEHATLDHHLLDVAQAQWIRHVPAYAREHHFQRVMQPPDHRAQGLDYRLPHVLCLNLRPPDLRNRLNRGLS
jgi:hypothetical protein